MPMTRFKVLWYGILLLNVQSVLGQNFVHEIIPILKNMTIQDGLVTMKYARSYKMSEDSSAKLQDLALNAAI
jgi:hypothetical protein